MQFGELIRVASLLADTADLVTPAPEPSILGLPLPTAPSKEALPSAEELIKSDKNGGDAA